MEYTSEKLFVNEKIEKKILIQCSYNNAKCKIYYGNIIHITNTNISFIEPHRLIIDIYKYQLVVLIYDENNVFLYNRHNQISIQELDILLKEIRKGKSNGEEKVRHK